MHPDYKAIFWKYMPLLVSMGFAAIVCAVIFGTILIPCVTGEADPVWCFGEEPNPEWSSNP